MNNTILDTTTMPLSPDDKWEHVILKTSKATRVTALPPAIERHSLTQSSDFPLVLIAIPLVSAICVASLSCFYFFNGRYDVSGFFLFFALMLSLVTAASLVTRQLVTK